MRFKKLLSAILSLILIISVTPTASIQAIATSEELHKYLGGRGVFYDAEGYRIIPKGKTWTLGPVSGHYDDYVTNVTWSTTNKNVVRLNSPSNQSRYCSVTAVNEGLCSVNGCVESYYALMADLKYMDNIHKFRVAQPAISILANDMSLNVGKTKMLNIKSTPSGNYSFYACEPVFTSSNPEIAKVDYRGNITALKKGKSTITVETSNGLEASCKITVTTPAVKKVKIKPANVTLAKGKTKKLNVIYSPANSKAPVKWKSSNSKVAKVDNKGVVTAKKAGTATITATVNSKIKSSCKIKVLNLPKKIKLKKSKITIRTDETFMLKYTLKPANAYQKLKWLSENTDVATVDSNGVITAKNPGETKITVKTSNNKKDTCIVTVKYPEAKEVSLDQNKLTLSVAEKEKLYAFVSPNKYEGRLSWKSDNPEVATVDEDGNVTAVGVGTAIITAKVNSKAYAECVVEVNDLPLDPYDYLTFKTSSHKSWAIDSKTIYVKDKSVLGFEVCQDSTKITGNEGITYLSSASLSDSKVIYNDVEYDKTIRLEFKYEFKENNITQYIFYIIFDGVKYKTTVSNSGWTEFEEV